jgi:hypothetical protein
VLNTTIFTDIGLKIELKPIAWLCRSKSTPDTPPQTLVINEIGSEFFCTAAIKTIINPLVRKKGLLNTEWELQTAEVDIYIMV